MPLNETGMHPTEVPINFLLDIDGTLAMTDHLYVLAFADLMRPYGYKEVDDEWFAKNVAGKTDIDVFRALLPEGTSHEELEACSKRKDDLFVEKVAKLGPTVVAGLGDALLMARKNGWRCIAVTNAQRGGGQAVLDFLKRELGEVAGVIEDLVVGCECPNAKPHPDPYVEGMKRLGAVPENCIVFEDSGTGARAGVAAQVAAVVGLRTSLTDEALRSKGCTVTVADWTEVTETQLRELVAT